MKQHVIVIILGVIGLIIGFYQLNSNETNADNNFTQEDQ